MHGRKVYPLLNANKLSGKSVGQVSWSGHKGCLHLLNARADMNLSRTAKCDRIALLTVHLGTA